jgi:glucokinase
MMARQYVIGVDIGGTHCTSALIDLQQKKIVPSTLNSTAINANGSSKEIIAAWSDCITIAKQDFTIDAVCLAMPGPFDYEAGISLIQGQNKYDHLYGLNIKELLGLALHLPPAAIFMTNDAACFLHGEVFGGVADKHVNDTVIGVTLGTGLGSAVYKKGWARSADLWNLPFKDGIAEDYLSTRWFVQHFKQLTGKTIKGVKELAQLAETNDAAISVFHAFGNNLGEFLLAFIKKENPTAIVVGGNISKAFALFRDPVHRVIADQYPHIKIKQAILGEEAPLLGAAGNWLFKLKM